MARNDPNTPSVWIENLPATGSVVLTVHLTITSEIRRTVLFDAGTAVRLRKYTAECGGVDYSGYGAGVRTTDAGTLVVTS